MHIQAHTDQTNVTANLTLPEFFEVPAMASIAARTNANDPAVALCDYLACGYEDLDDETLTQAVEEACIMSYEASADDEMPHSLELTSVQLDADDLVWFKQRFMPNNGMSLVEHHEPLLAA